MNLLAKFLVYLILVILLLLLIGIVFYFSFFICWNYIFTCPNTEPELCGKYIMKSMMGAGIISIASSILISKIIFFRIFPKILKKYKL